MAWQDLIDRRDTKRLARNLRHSAGHTRGLAQQHFGEFAREAGPYASRTRDLAQRHFGQFADSAGRIANRAAHELADYGLERSAELTHYGQQEAADIAREVARHYAERAQRFARDQARNWRNQAQPLIEEGLAEGAILAQQAARRAARMGRAVKADPLPTIIGVVGIALLASLLFNRRER